MQIVPLLLQIVDFMLLLQILPYYCRLYPYYCRSWDFYCRLSPAWRMSLRTGQARQAGGLRFPHQKGGGASRRSTKACAAFGATPLCGLLSGGRISALELLQLVLSVHSWAMLAKIACCAPRRRMRRKERSRCAHPGISMIIACPGGGNSRTLAR